MTKEQRAAEALRKRQEEGELVKKKQEEERKKRLEFLLQADGGPHSTHRDDRYTTFAYKTASIHTYITIYINHL